MAAASSRAVQATPRQGPAPQNRQADAPASVRSSAGSGGSGYSSPGRLIRQFQNTAILTAFWAACWAVVLAVGWLIYAFLTGVI